MSVSQRNLKKNTGDWQARHAGIHLIHEGRKGSGRRNPGGENDHLRTRSQSPPLVCGVQALAGCSVGGGVGRDTQGAEVSVLCRLWSHPQKHQWRWRDSRQSHQNPNLGGKVKTCHCYARKITICSFAQEEWWGRPCAHQEGPSHHIILATRNRDGDTYWFTWEKIYMLLWSGKENRKVEWTE